MDADSKMERMVAAYDFSSHLGSWFDMWHAHIDWNGAGTDNAELRQNYVRETIQTFDTFCSKLEYRSYPYQAWILIDRADSSEDAIYIHSPDPSSDTPFPFDIGLIQQQPAEDDAISRLFIEQQFICYVQPDYTDMVFFARQGVGLPLA